MKGFETITGEEHDLLEAKCQENGWLKRGGYDWQDDPYMEEFPYSFSRTESVESLREALGHGNWAIRQGFVYKDLAFVQQVNGGDEWWTCKQIDGEWLDFESWSFGRIAQNPAEFEDAIMHMHYATKEQCKSLDYMNSKVPEAANSLAARAQGARDAAAAMRTEKPSPGQDHAR